MISFEARLRELEADVARLIQELKDVRHEAEGATAIAISAIKRSADANLTVDLLRSDLGDEEARGLCNSITGR